MTLASAPSVVQTPTRSRLRFALVGVLVALLIVFVILKPTFLSFGNISQVLLASALLAIVATAEGIIVITRQIDLSVGSMVGLVAYLSTDLLRTLPGLPAPLVLLFGILLGGVLGTVNASLVLLARVPAIIATLGTLAIYRGVLFIFSNGGAITANQVPDYWTALASHRLLGIPLLVIVAAIVAVLAALALRYLRSGRLLYAIGSNGRAAQALGLPAKRGAFLAFVIGGALCGLAGVGWSSLYGTIDSTAATGYELQVLAAVVIGGIAVTGGKGAIWGAAAGAVFLVAITNILALLRIDSLWAQAIYGFVILAAVSIDGLSRLVSRQKA